jgi:hypothetical protein
MVRVNTKDFRFLTGQELVKSYAAPILYAPPAYRSTFCSVCGSPVPTPKPDGESFEIPAGVFDDDFGIRPDKHIFVDFVPAWDQAPRDLPSYTVADVFRLRTGRELPADFQARAHACAPPSCQPLEGDAP